MNYIGDPNNLDNLFLILLSVIRLKWCDISLDSVDASKVTPCSGPARSRDQGQGRRRRFLGPLRVRVPSSRPRLLRGRWKWKRHHHPRPHLSVRTIPARWECKLSPFLSLSVPLACCLVTIVHSCLFIISQRRYRNTLESGSIYMITIQAKC